MLCGSAVQRSAGEKDLLRLCLFRAVLDDVPALTGRGREFIAVGKYYQVDESVMNSDSVTF